MSRFSGDICHIYINSIQSSFYQIICIKYTRSKVILWYEIWKMASFLNSLKQVLRNLVINRHHEVMLFNGILIFLRTNVTFCRSKGSSIKTKHVLGAVSFTNLFDELESKTWKRSSVSAKNTKKKWLILFFTSDTALNLWIQQISVGVSENKY